MAETRSSNLTLQAYEAIKQSIISNELKQGDFISENALAKKLCMSRTPVREAIRILDKEGLLEVRNGVGVFVRYILNNEIYDLFEMRALLECTAARSALRHISPGEVRQMKGYWQDLRDRLENGELISEEEISRGYEQLHALLMQRCENKVLVKMDHDIHLQIVRLRNIFISALEDTRHTIYQHLEIVSCMERGDIEQLVKHLKQHMEQSVEYIIRTRSFVIG